MNCRQGLLYCAIHTHKPLTMSALATISKSSFIRGKQCLKSLYLHINEPWLKDEISEAKQHVFNIGHETGRLAQQLFPGGIDASRGRPQEVKEAVAFTQQLIAGGQGVIYEAAFSDGETLCYMDLLVKMDGEWQAFEVKASTAVKDYHLLDIAFQYHVILQSGLPLTEISLVHLNKKYVRRGEINIDQLFTVNCLRDHAQSIQAYVEENLLEMQTMLAAGQGPDIATGKQCTQPFECDFYGYCHQDEKDDLFTGLKGIRATKIERFRSTGTTCFDQVPVGMPLTAKERTVLRGLFENKSQQDDDNIRQFLGKLEYPLYFLDFETIMFPVPLYDESRPYQQMPFQYSLHKQEHPGGELQHHAFLGCPPEDPRPEFIRRLLVETGTEGSVVVYNKTFEWQRLRELARDFPAYAHRLQQLNKRLVDLMEPFRKQWLYMPGMKGSYSIKRVLPALVTGISYSDLEIQEGNAAGLIYGSLYRDPDPASIRKKRENLLAYCEMDTLGMVEILKVLNNLLLT